MTAIMDFVRACEHIDDLSDELAALPPLSLRQRGILGGAMAVVAVQRLIARAHAREAFAERMAAAPIARALAIRTRAGSALTDEVRAAFEQQGVAGPFRLLDEDAASALARDCTDALANPDNPLLEALKAMEPERAAQLHRDRDILLGTNLYMHHPGVRAALAHPAIGAVLGPLMNTDRVACWRSQIFRQRPGASTTLHQNIEFPEDFGHRSLTLAPGAVFRPNSALNVWLSLTSAGVDSGTLTVLGGTFLDPRVYDVGRHFSQHPRDLLTALSFFPADEARAMLSVILFSAGNHRGITKLMLRLADAFYADLFAMEMARSDFVSRPGEFWVFSSFNVHGALPTSGHATRLTLVGRYIDERTIEVGHNPVVLKLGRRITVDPRPRGWTSVIRPPMDGGVDASRAS